MAFSAAAILAIISPLFGTAWSVYVQVFFQACFFSLFFWGLLGDLLRDKISSFFLSGEFAALAGAFFFCFLSFSLSPVKSLIKGDWLNLCAGFSVLVMSALSSGRAGERAYKAATVCAAAVFAFALYEVFRDRAFPPVTLLNNSNSFALFFIMIAGLALEKKNRLLAAMSAAGVLLGASFGGFLVLLFFLGAAGIRAEGKTARKYLVFGALASVFLAFFFLNRESFLNRIIWWKDAWNIFVSSPLFGSGYASFTYVYPVFHKPLEGGLSSVYAHNYFLEFLADNGIFASALWFFFLLKYCLGGGKGAGDFFRGRVNWKKAAVAGALAHSFVDFGLSQPFLFWFFCWMAGSVLGEEKRYGSADLRFGKAYGAAVLPVLLAFFIYAGRQVRLANISREINRGGRPRLELIREAEKTDPVNPLVYKIKGDYLFGKLSGKKRDELFESALALETALFLNPYDVSLYARAEKIYEKAGEERLAEDLKRRKSGIRRYE